MEIWLDTIDLEEIAQIGPNPQILGLTTNPLLLQKDPKKITSAHNTQQMIEHFARIFELMGDKPVFLQTVSLDADSIVEEGRALISLANKFGGNAGLKIPAVSGGIEALTRLSREGYLLLGTAVFKPEQVYHVGKTNAQFAATYTARMTKHQFETQQGVNGVELIRQGIKVCDDYGFKTRLMAANFRDGETEVNDVLRIGNVIVTVNRYTWYNMDRNAYGNGLNEPQPFKLSLEGDLRKVLSHPQTKKAMHDFTDSIKANPAYLQMIYREILGRELTNSEVRDRLGKIEKTIEEEYA